MSDLYGFLAPIYQMLSQGVFGEKILTANRAFVDENLSNKLVIIGGGDGFAYQQFGPRLKGMYLEKSAKMLQIAQKNLKNSSLQFVHGEFQGQSQADCFLLPFVLDCLREEDILALLEKIKSCLSENGIVIISDFFPPKTRRQQVLSRLMLLFFRATTGHPRSDLPDYPGLLSQSGFCLLKEKTWEKGWIKAQVYGRKD
ncbi:methyltransferase [Algoriphagus confluentis]|uniref:O-methyltransferase C-terminal domain-containing protein n=1 Tax=Algoriphagus confluentis TaxID=1697556 RepID=A0ABQ6PJ31_9BACT|nr:hypothetical protein Aconfl_05940 [Algoriphagus confluentis]